MSDIISLLLTWSLPVATLALAIGTFRLARHTRKMAESTEKALKQNAQIMENEERHHQENLRPICIFERDLSRPLVNSGGSYIILGGSIVNKGNGIAIECVLHLILPSDNSYISIGMPTLGCGDRWLEIPYTNAMSGNYEGYYGIIIAKVDSGLDKSILDAFEKKEIIIHIKYKDIFGTWLTTVQKLNKDTNQYDATLHSLDDNQFPVDIKGLRRIHP